MHQPTERAAVAAVAAYNLFVALDGVGTFELEEANLLDERRWCFDTAESIALRDLGTSHPVTLAFRDPIETSGRGGAPRRVRLGRTVLGQKVDGSTYAIGWPHFTLMELKEVPKRRLYRSRSRSPPPDPYFSPQSSGALPPPLPPAPAPPAAPYFAQAHLLAPEAREPDKARSGPPVATILNAPSWGAPGTFRPTSDAQSDGRYAHAPTHNRPTSAKSFLAGGHLDKDLYKTQTSVINPSYTPKNTGEAALVGKRSIPTFSSGARPGTGGSGD